MTTGKNTLTLRGNKNKPIDAEEQTLPEHGTVEDETDSLILIQNALDERGFIKIRNPKGLKVDELCAAEAARLKEKEEYEQFMRDMITIYIHDTSERNADPVFEVSVNGHSELFKRGETKTVRRYIVEQLARSKPVHYDNEEYTKDDGTFGVRWPSRTGLRYGFQVVNDPNPRGGDWLKAVLSQP